MSDTPRSTPSMLLPRLSLAIASIAYAGFGAAFLIAPVGMAKLVHLAPERAATITELRAMYGGLEFGLALFLAWCLLKPAWWRAGLALQLASFGGLSFGRIVGITVDGAPTFGVWAALVVEILGAALAIAALVATLRRAPKPAATPKPPRDA